MEAFRLHFATPFVGSEDDPYGFILCPTGDDCFYSTTVYADGRIALDDHLGRESFELTAPEQAELDQLLFADEALKEDLAEGIVCPGLPIDYEVWIVASIRYNDGTEQVLGRDAVGCIAGS